MAYIQITTYCNMSCDHCSFSCKKGVKGEHMSRAHFKKALRLCEETGENIVLGGGEPTMHPNFWEYFGRSMGTQAEYVWMATNGSITEIAMALAEIARGSEKFGIALSTDYYHDPIDPKVFKRFKDYGLELRDVTENWGIVDVGSAAVNELGGLTDRCACDELTILPNGVIRMCGCPDSLVLGTIDDIDYGVLDRAKEVSRDETYCGSTIRKLEERHIDYIYGRRDNYDEQEVA